MITKDEERIGTEQDTLEETTEEETTEVEDSTEEEEMVEQEEQETSAETKSAEKYPDDLKAVLKKVREEEKAKLYGRIESLKSERDELKSQIESLTSKVSEFETALGNKDKETKSETQQLIDLVEELKGQIKTLEEARQQDKEQAEREKRDLQLKNYRSSKIEEAKGQIIPELVDGNSEAEIDASVIYAKKRYHEIIGGKIREQKKQDKQESEETPAVPPVNPPSSGGIGDLSPEEVRNMTPEEWAEKRKEILRNVTSQA